MDRKTFDHLAARHRTALTLDIPLASAQDAIAEVSQGWYERWDTGLRVAALKSLTELRNEIDRLMAHLNEPQHEQLQGACQQRLTRWNGVSVPCVLPAIHWRFGMDHVDHWGATYKPAVSWSTIVAAEALERGEPG